MCDRKAMNQTNYQKELDKTITRLQAQSRVPTLLLHACCAPCSSYVLEYLSAYFKITVLYYNPNISPRSEYDTRAEELKRLIDEMTFKYPVKLIVGEYEPEKFYAMAKGMEDLPEGGERCFRCYEQRLSYTAKLAKEQDFDYFTTTLSISPLKNAAKLNEIGLALEKECGVPYLVSDFKKKNGYKRSVELSAEHNLYRQNYCGCVFSKQADTKRQEQC